MARIQELLVALGAGKQTNISTANTAMQSMRFSKLNAQITNPKLVTENDAPEIGKGNEFIENVYKSHWEVGTTMEKYLSSEFAAWAFAYALGKVAVTGSAAPYTYTITPLNTSTDGLELPYFSVLEQIRPGSGVVIDRQHVGCALKMLKMSIGSGPGRANSKLSADIVGSGLLVDPSGLTMPAPITEHLLPASSLTFSCNGTDYVTSKNLVSLELGWDNAFLNTGFFPGSGSQAGAQVQGRIEVGARVPSFSFIARYNNGSSELAKLESLTTATCTLSLTADANNSLTITWQKMGFEMVEIGDTDGIVTVAVTCSPQYDLTNGIVSVVVVTPVAGICQ
jgi:hypothetical protein